MNAGELAALRDVRGYAAANRIFYSPHARERVQERCGSVEHVRHALTNATQCAANGARWKATGPDLDGDELTVVVVIEDGVIVVTVF
jgi:Domain of unknown function (DUF4258)